MRAAIVEALTPFPLASSANCFFQPSKPAAELPHCAALARLAIDKSAKAATLNLNRRPLVIENSFHVRCVRRKLVPRPAEIGVNTRSSLIQEAYGKHI